MVTSNQNIKMSELDQISSSIGVRRTYDVLQSAIQPKLSSKRDWYQFLEQHL